jgi:hypothetical protein
MEEIGSSLTAFLTWSEELYLQSPALMKVKWPIAHHFTRAGHCVSGFETSNDPDFGEFAVRGGGVEKPLFHRKKLNWARKRTDNGCWNDGSSW